MVYRLPDLHGHDIEFGQISVIYYLLLPSGEASPTIYSCYVNFLELMVCENNQFLKK